jgi:hypothetical protein
MIGTGGDLSPVELSGNTSPIAVQIVTPLTKGAAGGQS